MPASIAKRCQQRRTHAFVTPETVGPLGQKMIGLVADRRMTMMHRYLGEQSGTPRLYAGLRVWTGGLGPATIIRPGQSAAISLASVQRPLEGIGFSVGPERQTEEQLAERYHHPERQWLGERRDITLVELNGWPGSPTRDDSVRVEHWNQHGVGQETIVVFDDIDPIQEIAWIVKQDKEHRIHFEDEFCTLHRRHFEDPEHSFQPSRCALRPATLTENLTLLAHLGSIREHHDN